jgi:hypothetical protein
MCVTLMAGKVVVRKFIVGQEIVNLPDRFRRKGKPSILG